MRKTFLVMVAVCCLFVASCNWRPGVAVAQAAVESAASTLQLIRDQRQTAIDIGAPADVVAKWDKALADAQMWAESADAALVAAQNAPSWWTGVIAGAATLLSGSAGVAMLGAKRAADAARVLHALRAVSSGIDAFRDAAPKPSVTAVEGALRDTMTPDDKALIKELRAARA